MTVGRGILPLPGPLVEAASRERTATAMRRPCQNELSVPATAASLSLSLENQTKPYLRGKPVQHVDCGHDSGSCGTTHPLLSPRASLAITTFSIVPYFS